VAIVAFKWILIKDFSNKELSIQTPERMRSILGAPYTKKKKRVSNFNA
jgi:hypothetical protein